MRIKKNIIYFVAFLTVLFTVISCERKIKNHSAPNSKIEENYLDNFSLNEIKRLDNNWFNSWEWDKTALKSNSFHIELVDTIRIVWEDFDINDSYFKQFDSLLISSGNYAIDLYSYNTFIEREKGNILVGFEVDTKVYVIDKAKKMRCRIAQTGSIESIEDAIWLQKHIVMFGYTSDENEKNTPFIWFTDLDKGVMVIYEYSKSFKGERRNYFFTKYPNTKPNF